MRRKTFNPKIIVFNPTLPSEYNQKTIQSILNQTVPVSKIVVVTEKAPRNLSFPAKISYVLNHALQYENLNDYDYFLRVDSDTVLPPDFLEKNLALDLDCLGGGYAQLVKVKSFRQVCGGKFHPLHDDGYILLKMRFLGLRESMFDYAVKPIFLRSSGFHHGSSWFVSQGELKYRYGYDPVAVLASTLKHFSVHAVFELTGYFSALLHNRERFDIATPMLYRQLKKYRNPKRFLRVFKHLNKLFREVKV